MLEYYLDILLNDPRKLIYDKLDIVKEAFIEFYGEKYKTEIEEKFDDMTLVTAVSPEQRNLFLFGAKREFTIIKQSSFLEKIGCEDSFQNRKKYFGYGYPGFSDVGELVKDFKEIEKNISFSTKVFLKDNFGYDIDYSKGYFPNDFSEIIKLIPLYEEIINDYDKFASSLLPIEEKINKDLKEKETIFSKRYDEISNEASNYIPKEIIDEFNAKNINIKEVLLEKDSEFVFLVNALDSFSDVILENGAALSTSGVRCSRVSFFQKLGFNYGSKYEDYINTDAGEWLNTNKEWIIKLSSMIKDKREEAQSQYCSNLEEFKRNKKIVYREGLIYDDYYDYQLYNTTCVRPSLIKINNEFRIYPYINISGRHFYEGTHKLDKTIIHEMNHFIETKLVKTNSDEAIIHSGFEVFKLELNAEEIENDNENNFEHSYFDKRNTELLSEAFNDAIADRITAILWKKTEKFICPKEDRTLINTLGAYHTIVDFINPIMNEFKDDIIDCRMNGGFEQLKSVFGEENIDNLNDLVHEYYYISNHNRAFGSSEKSLEEMLFCEKRDKIINSMKTAKTNISSKSIS